MAQSGEFALAAAVAPGGDLQPVHVVEPGNELRLVAVYDESLLDGMVRDGQGRARADAILPQHRHRDDVDEPGSEHLERGERIVGEDHPQVDDRVHAAVEIRGAR